MTVDELQLLSFDHLYISKVLFGEIKGGLPQNEQYEEQFRAMYTA